MSNHGASTLINSFNEQLPAVHEAHDYQDASASSTTVQNTQPPAYLDDFNIESDNCWRIGTEKLQEMRATGALTQTYLPTTENFRLRTEADVVRAATLYLLHPITVALQHIANLEERRVYCCCEQVHDVAFKSRMDITWNFRDPTGSSNLVPFAILELKNINNIDKKDFEQAFINRTHGGSRQKLEETRTRLGNTNLIKKNGRAYMKQVSSYAINSRVRRQALFDWRSLVLIDFNRVNGGSVGQSARLAFMENEDGQQTFRKALFCWVYQAYVEVRGKSHPGPGPASLAAKFSNLSVGSAGSKPGPSGVPKKTGGQKNSGKQGSGRNPSGSKQVLQVPRTERSRSSDSRTSQGRSSHESTGREGSSTSHGSRDRREAERQNDRLIDRVNRNQREQRDNDKRREMTKQEGKRREMTRQEEEEYRRRRQAEEDYRRRRHTDGHSIDGRNHY